MPKGNPLNPKQNEKCKIYYQENKEKIKAYHKELYKNNKEKILEEQKAYRANNNDKIKEKDKNYRQKEENKIKAKEYSTVYREKNKDKIKEHKLKSKESQKIKRLKKVYNLSVEEYDSLIEQQGNKCKVCEVSFEENWINIDHCHSTGKIRGLLCVCCNLALGGAKDDINILNKLINYLEESRKTP